MSIGDTAAGAKDTISGWWGDLTDPGTWLRWLHLQDRMMQQALVVLVAFLIVSWLIAKAVRNRPRTKDTRRLFTPEERLAMFMRAGNRCEHKPLLWFRCSAAPAHGDHIYPWSKGGATTMSNSQGLCAPHNLGKSNHIPSRWYIARLERRRRKYFPPGERVEVYWKVGSRV